METPGIIGIITLSFGESNNASTAMTLSQCDLGFRVQGLGIRVSSLEIYPGHIVGCVFLAYQV